MKDRMGHRFKTPEGKALYKLRKQTVEPVFGIIKEVLGFRRFSMRGKQKAETEWSLVCLSYNLKKMFNLTRSCAPKRPATTARQRVCVIFALIRGLFGAQGGMRRILWPFTESWTWYGVLTPTDC